VQAESSTLTVLLRRWSAGDPDALAQITSLVYGQLRILASGYLKRERPGHTLQPTALINEAYLRLLAQHQAFESRRQFYGVAAHLMRTILVDHARAHRAAKRGGDQQNLSIDTIEPSGRARAIDLLALDEALERLAVIDQRKSAVVELHHFAGLSAEEISETVGCSVATVRRDLKFGETWLCRQLTKGMSDSRPQMRSRG
jgi:RNA polymerase sigma factor (TIGR02999 family)